MTKHIPKWIRLEDDLAKLRFENGGLRQQRHESPGAWPAMKIEASGFNVCPRCGYEWQPRVLSPKSCPRCKTRLDRKKKDDVSSNKGRI